MSMLFKRISQQHGNEILFPLYEPDCNLLQSARINAKVVTIKKGQRAGQHAMFLAAMNENTAAAMAFSLENGLLDNPGSQELRNVWWINPDITASDADGNLPFGVVVYMNPAATPSNCIEVLAYRSSFVGSECLGRDFHMNTRHLPLMFAARAFDHDMETIVTNSAKFCERALGHWGVLNLDVLAKQDLAYPKQALANSIRTFFSEKQRIDEY